MFREGMQVSCKLHFKGSKKWRLTFWKQNKASKLDWYTRMDTEIELERQKIKTKNWHGCFEINSMFRTSVNLFFSKLPLAKNMVQVIGGKIIKEWSQGKQKLLPVIGWFQLSWVRNDSKCMEEIDFGWS